MKYSKSNKPIVCMQTTSNCYKNTRTMKPLGILWHSTGANNPNLSRYVQPSDNAKDREEMLKLIGTNTNGTDWNHTKVQAGLNCWIGKLADGTVTTIQTMPWNYRPWGCGSSSKGSCNDGWIQFEICEDALTDKLYFDKVYKEGCEITAYLCEMYNINPKGTATLNGVKVPTILCHADAHALKLGSNHADILHWFRRYGKTMDDVREDVAKLMKKPVVQTIETTVNTTAADPKVIWDFFKKKGLSEFGIAGLMGNLYAESSLRPCNLQNGYEKTLDMTDAEYTVAVDNGTYTNFVKDKAGYGLAQWTYWSLKEDMLEFHQSRNKSIGDLQTQLEFLAHQLSTDFKEVWEILKDTDSVKEASNAVLLKFERPADQSEAVQKKRAEYGEEYYSQFKTVIKIKYRVRQSWLNADSQKGAFASLANAKKACDEAGYGYHVFDALGKKVYSAKFKSYKVKIDTDVLRVRAGAGTAYPTKTKVKRNQVYTIVDEKNGWGKLKSGAGWISLKYTKRV